jgi:hypothetical protein
VEGTAFIFIDTAAAKSEIRACRALTRGGPHKH